MYKRKFMMQSPGFFYFRSANTNFKKELLKLNILEISEENFIEIDKMNNLIDFFEI